MFEWQTVGVILIILAAAIYTGRLAWLRLRSFRESKGAASCETGCGSCGDTEKPSATKRTTFVEISRSKPPTRSRS